MLAKFMPESLTLSHSFGANWIEWMSHVTLENIEHVSQLSAASGEEIPSFFIFCKVSDSFTHHCDISSSFYFVTKLNLRDKYVCFCERLGVEQKH